MIIHTAAHMIEELAIPWIDIEAAKLKKGFQISIVQLVRWITPQWTRFRLEAEPFYVDQYGSGVHLCFLKLVSHSSLGK